MKIGKGKFVTALFLVAVAVWFAGRLTEAQMVEKTRQEFELLDIKK